LVKSLAPEDVGSDGILNLHMLLIHIS
jgi:hypothetical protein